MLRIPNYDLTVILNLKYVGLSAPMLGAINPLRAVISGENMGYVYF